MSRWLWYAMGGGLPARYREWGLLAVAGGIRVGMIYALAYLDEAGEHRALKAGFARGTVKAVRDDADAGAREAAAARYTQRYRRDAPTTPRSSE